MKYFLIRDFTFFSIGGMQVPTPTRYSCLDGCFCALGMSVKNQWNRSMDGLSVAPDRCERKSLVTPASMAAVAVVAAVAAADHTDGSVAIAVAGTGALSDCHTDHQIVAYLLPDRNSFVD